ncbi:sulfite exporter TauE/SafE [Aureococcus anophagefferens]|nr:sulfite exporter TauE/SafE [Aureococcus anophagefferens]
MAQRRHPVDDVMHVREPTDCKAFCLKYFCEGQRLEASLEEKLQADKVEWTVKYRKQRAPASVGQMRKYRDPNGTPPVDLLRGDVRPWYMSVTMVFGSMVAGMTSEGGASVAFPVMTLAMDVKPHVAKQFSYMIQSVGMTAAAFVILYMQVRVEWKSITYCSVGGVVGLIYGLEEIAPVLTPPYAKMYFVVIWGSFAASLYYLNRIHGRKVYLVLDPAHPEIWKSADLTPYWWANLVLNWKALVLLAAGFIGASSPRRRRSMERNARIEKEVLGDPDDVEKAAEAPAVAAVVGAEPAEGAFLKES